MTEAINATKLLPKKIRKNASPLLQRADKPSLIQESDGSKGVISRLTTQTRKRKAQAPVQRAFCRYKKLKQTSQNHAQSLEGALKGVSLSGNQVKQKEMLEILILRGDGERVSLSQYLHENNFSYESQASILRVKNAHKYRIHYLVSLFFDVSENPLIEDGVDEEKLKRISNQWKGVQAVVKDLDLEISAEQVVLSLLKKQGDPYERIIIFFELFKSSLNGFSKKDRGKMVYPQYEDLMYPFPKSQFVSDILEIAEAGSLCLKEFLATFVKPSSEEVSEWEQINECLWQDFCEIVRTPHLLVGFMFRDEGRHWRIVSDNRPDSVSRKLSLVSQEGQEAKELVFIFGESNEVFIQEGEIGMKPLEKGVVFVKDPNVLEPAVFNSLVKCVKTHGVSKNKQAFLESLTKPEKYLGCKKVTLLNLLRSEKFGGLSLCEAMQVIVKCSCVDSGYKNKQAFLESMKKPEIVLNRKKVSVYNFLISEKGGAFNSSEAIHLITKCVGIGGGCKNKQAFIECLNKREIYFDGEMVSLCAYLRAEQGGGLGLVEAIQLILKLVSSCGGCKNKQAFLDCINQPEIDLGGKKVSVHRFLCSENGAGLSVSESVHVLAKCISRDGGCKNKQAVLECLAEKEIDLDGERVSLYDFLCLKQYCGLSSAEAINEIVRCVGNYGGLQNKQALLECFTKRDLDLDGNKVALFTFLCSKKGGQLSVLESFRIMTKCIGTDGGSKNKQALIDCLTELEIDLDGKIVSLYNFLISKNSVGLNPTKAMKLIVAFISRHGGSKNKQAFIDCLKKLDLDLDGKKVSLYIFLISKQGAGLSKLQAIQVITKCIGQGGGGKNQESLIACFCEKDLVLDGKKVSLYTFLSSQRGGMLSTFDTIQIIVKCIGNHGGSKNKDALMKCFSESEINLDGKMVSLYEYLCLKQGGDVSPSEAVRLISNCIGQHGGVQNKQALIDCMIKLEIDLNGQSVSLYTFLTSKNGAGFSSSKAIKIIVVFISRHGGARNKQAFIACLKNLDLDLDGEKVSLYNFLISKNGGGLSEQEALHVITKCINQHGGAKNKQALIANFNLKLLGGRLSLFEMFLSSNMTRNEAVSLCVIFSVNRYALNTKDVLNLFEVKKDGHSVISLLNSLDISCYDTLLHLLTKILDYTNTSTETKRTFFSSSCQSLVNMFLAEDGYYLRMRRENPTWSATILGEMCVDACILYTGKDILHELRERETVLLDWFCQFEDDYRLTKESVDVLMHVQRLDVLKLLIELSNKEIQIKQKKNVDSKYYEACLKAGLQIVTDCKQSTIKAILKYGSILLNWFDLNEISLLFTTRLKTEKMDESIHYFLEKRKGIGAVITHIDLKNIFLMYMGLSTLTPLPLRPLKLEAVQHFFEHISEKDSDMLVPKNWEKLHSLYTIYNRFDELEKKVGFHEIIKMIIKVFDSYEQFKEKYQNRIKDSEWPLFIKLIQKWDLKKDVLTQDEWMFLIRIKYKLPTEIDVSWSDFSELENSEIGCFVSNRTRYPHWVFALAYLKRVRDYLSLNCESIELEDGVAFKSFDSNKLDVYMFLLFKIQLHKEGFVFKGMCVEDVDRFYVQSGLKYYMDVSQLDFEKVEVLEPKKPMNEDSLSIADVRIKKRKNDSSEDMLPQAKQMKLVTKEMVYNLFETVSKREILTQDNCEIFMQGSRYLSEKMLDFLSKKIPIVEIGNKQFREKWEDFVRECNRQSPCQMPRCEDLVGENKIELTSNRHGEEISMLYQQGETLFTPIPEFEDKNFSFLPQITVDSLVDFWEQDFDSENRDFFL